MPSHKQRLAKLESHQSPPQRSREEIDAEINQLLAKVGTTLENEIAKYGSLSQLMNALRPEVKD